MRVYESISVDIYLKEENSTIILDWKDKTGDWSDKDFERENKNIVQLVERYKPKYLLSLSKTFFYPITPDQQMWLVDNVFAAHKKNGITKMAVIMSDEFISQLSLEQLVDETGIIPTALFADEEAARKWLYL
jgi:hypothetical protein